LGDKSRSSITSANDTNGKVEQALSLQLA